MSNDNVKHNQPYSGQSGEIHETDPSNDFDVLRRGSIALDSVQETIDAIEEWLKSVRANQGDLDEQHRTNAMEADTVIRKLIGQLGVLSIDLKQLIGKDSGTRPDSVVAHSMPTTLKQTKKRVIPASPPPESKSPHQTALIQNITEYLSGLSNSLPEIRTIEDIKIAETLIAGPLKGEPMRVDDVREIISDARANHN